MMILATGAAQATWVPLPISGEGGVVLLVTIGLLIAFLILLFAWIHRREKSSVELRESVARGSH